MFDDTESATTAKQGNAKFDLPREKLLYISAIDNGGPNPDMIFTVGADPDAADYGQIIHRADMPELDDEVHHFGYSHDKKRFLVPGVFSQRMNVFDVATNPRAPAFQRVTSVLDSGYIVPHTVVPFKKGQALVTMIGAATETTGPGGIIVVDDTTGNFIDYFGPGPERTPYDVGPTYMYDFDYHHGIGVSSTFGWPANVGGGINPAGLGNLVAVWDMETRTVVQEVDLGQNNGALEVRFIKKPGKIYGYTNNPGTSTCWLFEDEDGDGTLQFHQVLGPEDGLLIPGDMLLSHDGNWMYVTNWFGNTVQQFDITDRFNPVLKATAPIPHPNMIRISTDGKRLYVTNTLLSTWDNDPAFGGPRNTDYGVWAYDVDTENGGLTSFVGGDGPWIDFDNVAMKNSVGPAGAHQVHFDAAAMVVDHH